LDLAAIKIRFSGFIYFEKPLNTPFPAPTIKRRIAVALYEMLILLGVWAAGYLVPNLLLGVFLKVSLPKTMAFAHVYLLFGAYFVWYWKKTGQTLAMQTWQVKLVDTQGHLLTRNHALKRYAIASLWLIPSIVIYGTIRYINQQALGLWPTIELMFTMVLFLWPMTCLFDKKNPLGPQSLADRWSGTRLIQLPK
jgi:uncharacterized RDD family membrane protein YckC